MVCCVCKKNEATVHLTQVLQEKVQKVDLCEACAKEKGVTDPTGFHLAELLLGLGSTVQEAPAKAAPPDEMACPHCGFTQADFKKAGRLGCPECYETFKDHLMPLLKSMHKGARHVGKRPGIEAAPPRSPRNNPAGKPTPAAEGLPQRLKILQKQLAKAIETEDFEQAAQLRDAIKDVNARLAQPAGT